MTLAGCGARDEEVAESEKPAVAFEGKPDPALVGRYKTKDGTVYVLGDKGDFHFDGKANTPKGPVVTHGEGRWARNGGRLLFKDASGVVPYDLALKGKNLALTLTGKMKNETVFVRQ